jgi:hypothetical protein
MIDPTTVNLSGKRTASLSQCLAYVPDDAAQPGSVRIYLRELSRMAHIAGLDLAVLAAQAAHECSRWRSPLAASHRNYAGMKTADAAEYVTFPGGKTMARAQVVQMTAYVYGDVALPTTITKYLSVAPRYEIALDAYGGSVEHLSDLGNGRWAEDPNYAQGVAAHLERIRAMRPEPNDDGPTSDLPTIVVDAGHRSTDRSGNPIEMSLTGFLARDYVTTLRNRGYNTYWYQRDLDRDADPDETVGDLNTVALGIGRWMDQTAGKIVFLSCHYNGEHSPLHTIVADNVGLSTAYPQGRVSDDTVINNPLDLIFATRIMFTMTKAQLGPLYHGTGIMSERETGVGRDGFRLAVMAATAPYRDRAVRLVIEHGGYADAAALRDDFTVRCADAVADALDSICKGDRA